MNTVIFSCGCSISRSMFGEREVREVHHCQQHWNLFSQDKTLRQMAEEIRAVTVDVQPTLGISVSEHIKSQEKLG